MIKNAVGNSGKRWLIVLAHTPIYGSLPVTVPAFLL